MSCRQAPGHVSALGVENEPLHGSGTAHVTENPVTQGQGPPSLEPLNPHPVAGPVDRQEGAQKCTFWNLQRTHRRAMPGGQAADNRGLPGCVSGELRSSRRHPGSLRSGELSDHHWALGNASKPTNSPCPRRPGHLSLPRRAELSLSEKPTRRKSLAGGRVLLKLSCPLKGGS